MNMYMTFRRMCPVLSSFFVLTTILMLPSMAEAQQFGVKEFAKALPSVIEYEVKKELKEGMQDWEKLSKRTNDLPGNPGDVDRQNTFSMSAQQIHDEAKDLQGKLDSLRDIRETEAGRWVPNKQRLEAADENMQRVVDRMGKLGDEAQKRRDAGKFEGFFTSPTGPSRKEVVPIWGGGQAGHEVNTQNPVTMSSKEIDSEMRSLYTDREKLVKDIQYVDSVSSFDAVGRNKENKSNLDKSNTRYDQLKKEKKIRSDKGVWNQPMPPYPPAGGAAAGAAYPDAYPVVPGQMGVNPGYGTSYPSGGYGPGEYAYPPGGGHGPGGYSSGGRGPGGYSSGGGHGPGGYSSGGGHGPGGSSSGGHGPGGYSSGGRGPGGSSGGRGPGGYSSGGGHGPGGYSSSGGRSSSGGGRSSSGGGRSSSGGGSHSITLTPVR